MPPTIIAGAVLFPTFIPNNDICCGVGRQQPLRPVLQDWRRIQRADYGRGCVPATHRGARVLVKVSPPQSRYKLALRPRALPGTIRPAAPLSAKIDTQDAAVGVERVYLLGQSS